MIKRERKPKRKREKILKPFWHFVQVREQSKHENQTRTPILDHLHYVLLGLASFEPKENEKIQGNETFLVLYFFN